MAKTRLLCCVAVLAVIAYVAHAVALRRVIGVNDAVTDQWLRPMAIGSVRNGVGAGEAPRSPTRFKRNCYLSSLVYFSLPRSVLFSLIFLLGFLTHAHIHYIPLPLFLTNTHTHLFSSGSSLSSLSLCLAHCHSGDSMQLHDRL